MSRAVDDFADASDMLAEALKQMDGLLAGIGTYHLNDFTHGRTPVWILRRADWICSLYFTFV